MLPWRRRYRPGRRCDSQGQQQKTDRIPIGDTDHGSLTGLRCFHKTNDTRIRAFRRGSAGNKIERRSSRGRSTQCLFATEHFAGKGLAGQRRKVENSDLAGDPSIDWKNFALSDKQPICGTHRVDRYFLQPGIAIAHRRMGDAAHQCRHFPPRPALRKGLQECPRQCRPRPAPCGEIGRRGTEARRRTA